MSRVNLRAQNQDIQIASTSLRLISVEHQIRYRQQLVAYQQQHLLNDSFPVGYVNVHSTCLILLGLLAILLEVYSQVQRNKRVTDAMLTEPFIYSLESGFWAGSVGCIAPGVLSLIFTKKRELSYFVTSLVLNSLGLVLVLVGLVVMHMVDINLKSCFFPYVWSNIKTSLSSKSQNTTLNLIECSNDIVVDYSINLGMVIIGLISVIYYVAYFIALPVSVFSCMCNKSSYPLVEYYSSQQQEQLNELQALTSMVNALQTSKRDSKIDIDRISTVV